LVKSNGTELTSVKSNGTNLTLLVESKLTFDPSKLAFLFNELTRVVVVVVVVVSDLKLIQMLLPNFLTLLVEPKLTFDPSKLAFFFNELTRVVALVVVSDLKLIQRLTT
jgi:hypothetical protein